MPRVPLAALLLGTLLVAGCVDGPLRALPAPEPPADVLGTFYPLAFLAERIAGGDVTVGTVVPAGAAPHDWEPSPRDLLRLGEAELVLAQGAGFDLWLDGLVRNLGEGAPRVHDTTATLRLLPADAGDAEEHDDEDGEHTVEHAHGSVDPHTWLDPVLFAEQARVVEAALRSAFPEHDRAFKARADALVADLLALDAEWTAGLADCERRVVIVSHDAFTYAATRYDFRILSVSGLAPEAEPDPATLARLVEAAREHGVRIVFFEELVSPGVVEVVAREVGAETRVLSPVEGLTPEARAQGVDYLTLMRANLAGLREAMGCA